MDDAMQQRLNYVTLAVADVARSRAFYVDGLGWTPLFEADDVLMIEVAPGVVLSLWDRAAFEAETGRSPGSVSGVTLAHNVTADHEVDAAVEAAVAAGAQLVKAPARREWGGYTGYVADPDDHLWEIAHNPSETGHAQVETTRAWLRDRPLSG